VEELAAYIVATVRDAVIDSPIGDRYDVEALIDEDALLRIAREEVERALPAVAEAVVSRVREDLIRGLNT
jgi:hypothetical protein